MLGFGAIGQFAIGQVGSGVTAEFIGPDKFMQPFSDPIRFPMGLGAAQQAYFFFDPLPIVSFSWFAALAEPVRAPRRSPAALAQDFFMQPAPSPFVATGWFQALSEPVRFPQGVKASQQAFFTADTTPIPISKLIPWFQALAEPVRFPQGLRASLQAFFAAPSQLRPTPTTTGTWASLETPDIFLGGASVWSRIVSGEIGVIETTFSGAEIGVIEQAFSAGTSGLIEQQAAPAPGSAVPAITSAHISIVML